MQVARFSWLNRLLCLLALLPALAGPRLHAQTPQLVRDVGDPLDITIHGATTWSPEQIRVGLLHSQAFLRTAADRLAVSDWLAAIDQEITRGYRLGGFPDVAVEVELQASPPHPVVTIVEGPRYSRGELRVEGVSDAHRATILRLLTEPHMEAGEKSPRSPFWQPGKPFPFREGHSPELISYMRRALAWIGYSDATWEVNYQRNSARHTCDLVLTVDALGPPTRVAGIEIEGAERHTSAQIIAWLDLTPDTIISGGLIEELEQRLWASGRFLEQEVRVENRQGGGAQVRVRVQEVELVPLLDQPLRETDRLLLSFAAGYSVASWAGDCTLASSYQRGPLEPELTATADGNLIVSQRFEIGTRKVPLTFWLHGRRLRAYAPDHNLQATIDSTPFNIALSVAFRKPTAEDLAEKPNALLIPALEFGLATSSSGNAGSITFSSSMMPAAVLWAAYQPGVTANLLPDGRLTLEQQNFLLEIDTRANSPVRLRYMRPDDRLTELRWRQGAYQQAVAALEQSLAEVPDISGEHPLIGAMRFAQSVARAPGEARSPVATQAIDRLLEGFDMSLLAGMKPHLTKVFPLAGEAVSAAPTVPRTMALLAAQIAHLASPDSSWPRDLSRALVAAAGGQKDAWAAAMDDLATSPDYGPLAAYTAAWFSRFVNPRIAVHFARQGRSMIAPSDFRNDMQVLTSEDGRIGQIILSLANGVRRLTPQDAAAIEPELPESIRPFYSAYVQAITARPTITTRDALLHAGDRWWIRSFSDTLRDHLRAISGP